MQGRLFAICLALAVAPLCGSSCGGDYESVYQIDGVPVVVENGHGPIADDMRLATEAYRVSAYGHFDLHPREEIKIWRTLREIRWTDDIVVGEVNYNYEKHTIKIHWDDCVLATALYTGFADHYSFVIYDDATVNLEHRVWAETIAYPVGAMLCPEQVAY